MYLPFVFQLHFTQIPKRIWPFIFLFIFTYDHPLCQSGALQVMSYNIRFANPADGVHDWEHRRPLMASLIGYHEPDIIGVQEAHRKQLDNMIQDMPQYEWSGVCRTDGSTQPDPDNEFSAILYRKARFDKLDGHTFWLSETPDKIASTGWDAVFPRIATWVKLKDKETNRIFYVFNTHFDHVGETARKESAALLLKKISEIATGYAVILTGDFNCIETEAPYQILTDSANNPILADALQVSQSPHHGPLATFASSFTVSGLGDRRIDFIFVTKTLAVVKHAILTDSWHGDLASDHLPVFCRIILP